MKTLLLIGFIGGGMMMAASSMAASPSAAGATASANTSATNTSATNTSAKNSPAKTVKPTRMTCQDFLSLDEVTRPQIVYWSEGFTRKGKPEDVVFDVDQVNRLIPVLVEDCRDHPQATYWTRLKEDIKRIF